MDASSPSLEEAACVLDSLRSLGSNAQAEALHAPAAFALRAVMEGKTHLAPLLAEAGRFADGTGARMEGENPFLGGPRLRED